MQQSALVPSASLPGPRALPSRTHLWKLGAAVQVGDPEEWPDGAQGEGKTTFFPRSRLILFSVLPLLGKLGPVGQHG